MYDSVLTKVGRRRRRNLVIQSLGISQGNGRGKKVRVWAIVFSTKKVRDWAPAANLTHCCRRKAFVWAMHEACLHPHYTTFAMLQDRLSSSEVAQKIYNMYTSFVDFQNYN